MFLVKLGQTALYSVAAKISYDNGSLKAIAYTYSGIFPLLDKFIHPDASNYIGKTGYQIISSASNYIKKASYSKIVGDFESIYASAHSTVKNYSDKVGKESLTDAAAIVIDDSIAYISQKIKSFDEMFAGASPTKVALTTVAIVSVGSVAISYAHAHPLVMIAGSFIYDTLNLQKYGLVGIVPVAINAEAETLSKKAYEYVSTTTTKQILNDSIDFISDLSEKAQVLYNKYAIGANELVDHSSNNSTLSEDF